MVWNLNRWMSANAHFSRPHRGRWNNERHFEPNQLSHRLNDGCRRLKLYRRRNNLYLSSQEISIRNGRERRIEFSPINWR